MLPFPVPPFEAVLSAQVASHAGIHAQTSRRLFGFLHRGADASSHLVQIVPPRRASGNPSAVGHAVLVHAEPFAVVAPRRTLATEARRLVAVPEVVCATCVDRNAAERLLDGCLTLGGASDPLLMARSGRTATRALRWWQAKRQVVGARRPELLSSGFTWSTATAKPRDSALSPHLSVVIPITRPCRSMSGPPLLPTLIAASV